jgi:tRNA G26 N,N-dimethylase Trm1
VIVRENIIAIEDYLQAAVGAAARHRAKEKFSAEPIVSHYVDFYRRTCSADTLRDGAGM